MNRDRIARIIAPEWFGDHDGKHVLDNYPDQHIKYQQAAYEKADQIIASIERDMHIVLFGGLSDGFKAYGPFDSFAEADRWADDIGEGGDFTMKIHNPATFE